jgi:4'-phosphopantetheinyl transferase
MPDPALKWSMPPNVVDLEYGEVHAWRIELGVSTRVIETLATVLSNDEIERADRFRTAQLRSRFIAGRSILRLALGKYLRIEPSAVAIRYEARGKPALDGIESGLQFNLTHSDGSAVCAVARQHLIGVDIERLRPIEKSEALVRRFFSSGEQDEFAGIAVGLRDEAFLRGWTRKEAYLKALGLGITSALDRFDVSLTPGEPPRLIRGVEERSGVDRWALVDVDPDVGFVGSLACNGPICAIQTFDARSIVQDFAFGG